MKAIKHKAAALCLGVLAALPLAADAMQTGRLGAVVRRTMPIRLTPNEFTSRHFQPASGGAPHVGGPKRGHIGARVCEFGSIVGLDAPLGG